MEVFRRKVAPNRQKNEQTAQTVSGTQNTTQDAKITAENDFAHVLTDKLAKKAQEKADEQQLLEQKWRDIIHEKLIKLVDLSLLGDMDDEQARKEIQSISHRLLNDESVPLNAGSRKSVVQQIEDEILGLGPLEPLLNDSSVADILINRHDMVYVERAGKMQLTRVRFRDDAHLMNIIDRIVSNVGRRIDESSPMVDARLKDGSRVNAIIPPLAIDGPSMSIRRFTVEKLKAEDLVRVGSLTPAIVQVLQAVIRGRLNVIISGGTGSGKTTMLNVLSNFIPESDRVITIEDSAELQLQQPHVLRLETRPSNIEGKGEISQRDLVKNSLRMRPDRIVIGEVRAGEALDMLQAMNTGHDGSLATLHANNPRDALTRLETMIMMAGVNLPIKAMRAQMASAVNVVLQVERMEDGKRRLVSLQEIQGMEGDVITMMELFKFERRGVDQDGMVIGELRATGMVPKFQDHLRQRGLELDFALFDPDVFLERA